MIKLTVEDKKQLINFFPKIEITSYHNIVLIQYYDELYIEEKENDLIEEKKYDNNDDNEEDDSDSIQSNEKILNEDIFDESKESFHSEDEEFFFKNEKKEGNEDDDDDNDDNEEEKEEYISKYKLNKYNKYMFKVEEIISDIYLSVWHFTKKYPEGYFLFSEYIDTWKMGYNKSDILKINTFEIKREDEENYFKIEKILTKILRVNEEWNNSEDLTERKKWLNRGGNFIHNLLDYLFLLIKKTN